MHPLLLFCKPIFFDHIAVSSSCKERRKKERKKEKERSLHRLSMNNIIGVLRVILHRIRKKRKMETKPPYVFSFHLYFLFSPFCVVSRFFSISRTSSRLAKEIPWRGVKCEKNERQNSLFVDPVRTTNFILENGAKRIICFTVLDASLVIVYR